MRKVHLAMDTATSDIRAVEFTPSREGDSSVLPDLLGQIPEDEDIGTVTADGAYDMRRCHGAIIARGGTAIIPIRRNGRCRVALKSVLPQFVWRNYPELGTFGRDSRDFKKALVARERRFGSRR